MSPSLKRMSFTLRPRYHPNSSKAAQSFRAWYDESAPIARNSKIESIIGKTLYNYAWSDVDSAILAANKSGIEAYSVKYEDAYPRSIEVRYDENFMCWGLYDKEHDYFDDSALGADEFKSEDFEIIGNINEGVKEHADVQS